MGLSSSTSKDAVGAAALLRQTTGNLIARYAGQAISYVILVVLGIVFLVPMAWLVTGSIKPEDQVAAYPPVFIPREFVFSNYPEVMAKFPFWSSLRNTMVIMVGVQIGHLLTASFTAYVFARVRFPLRDALFVLVLSTLMIPYHVYLIPQYLLFRELGWLNSPLPLIVPQLFGQSPFFIFLFRQFIRTIPGEYDEAARIDGCGWLAIYWRIIIPLILPAMGATAIFTFMGTWNDFLAPLIYLNEPKNQTLAIAIRTMEAMSAHLIRVPWNELMAISVILTVPPMLLFFFAQRYFVQGVVISGIKG